MNRETERDWDKDLADDVKSECATKYGPVQAIKVEKETQVCDGFVCRYHLLTTDKGEIYVLFETVDAAGQAIEGLNGRWFGGRQISAAFISDAIMQAHR